jgi:bleomycin hydrolase
MDNKMCRMERRAGTLLVVGVTAFIFSGGLSAQTDRDAESPYVMEAILAASPVKDQGRSGTCWSFATVSFLESELLRTGKGTYDLSEMFAVRAAYLAKADKYVRMHGTINFGEGGEANDVTAALAHAGMIPESVYPSPGFDPENFDFNGMDRALKDYVDRVIRTPEDSVDPEWKKGFESILDRYLGEVPAAFSWQGIEYTPSSFAESLGLFMNDYVLIGSYLHHPFYTGFILEIPDNWSWEPVYNMPLDEMMNVLDRSLELGFTVVWAADITEPGFSFDEGRAVILEEENGRIDETNMKPLQPEDTLLEGSTDSAEPGINMLPYMVTQKARQEAFDHYETQDDHAMHIIGKALDGDGNRFYYIKNSWGIDNVLKGYLFASEDYLRYKTISLFVNKRALDGELLKKLHIP